MSGNGSARATEATADRRPDDRGASLIEITISVVLIGMLIAGLMTAMRTTVRAGTLHRDHSIAHGWLQSASDVLYAEDKTNCNPAAPDPVADRLAIIAQYDAVLDTVPTPQDWQGWQIGITDLQFWNSFAPAPGKIERSFGFAHTCEAGLELQLVSIEVRNPNNEIIESVEIVK